MKCWAHKGDLVHDPNRAKSGKQFGPHGVIVGLSWRDDPDDPEITVRFFADKKQGWTEGDDIYAWSQLAPYGDDFDGKNLFQLPKQDY